MSSTTRNHPILFYDGYCNLCNGTVQFVLNHEKSDQIRFASLQSETGQRILNQYGLENEDSIVFKTGDRIFIQSDAALKVSEYLKAPYRYLHLFGFLPKKFRDYLYDLIARYRYRIFGRSNTCEIPSKADKERFIDM